MSLLYYTWRGNDSSGMAASMRTYLSKWLREARWHWGLRKSKIKVLTPSEINIAKYLEAFNVISIRKGSRLLRQIAPEMMTMMTDGRMMGVPSHESTTRHAIDDFPNFPTYIRVSHWQIVSGDTFDISLCSDRSFSKVVVRPGAINCLQGIASTWPILCV